MASRQNCSVFGCKNTYGKAVSERRLVQFYGFPSRSWENDRKEAWIHFVKRKNLDGTPWTPTKNAKICSDHFIGGEKSNNPANPAYNPTIFSLAVANSSHSSTLKNRFMRHSFRRNKADNRAANPLYDPDNNQLEGSSGETCCLLPKSNQESSTQTEQENPSSISFKTFECCSYGQDKQTFVEHQINVEPALNGNVMHAEACCGPNNRTAFFGGFEFLKNEDDLKHLTGVSNNTFALLQSLFTDNSCRIDELAISDKLLLTLMKLKGGQSFQSIGALFGIHRVTARSIFYSLIYYIHKATANWIYFPSKQAVRETLPEAFKKDYANCRVIIDCTEMRTETPMTVEQRVHLWSNYKSSFTAKYLIGITPHGFVSFISKGYGGRATDSFITNDCGILSYLEHGDVVLADKGFPSVQVKDGVTFVMPPFSSSNMQQFTSDQMNETYKIASVRIHVERAIQRLKIFKILSEKIPTEQLPHLDRIVYVCAVLVNLGSPIIKQ